MKFLVVCAAFLGLVTAVPVAVPNGNIEERQCEPVKCHGDGTVNGGHVSTVRNNQLSGS
ncbi:hypothetical protein TUN199_11974 [Pyrenophora tritici-repentis]|nr:hypothetical protein Alg130_12104 [Pyrenophora tritici-repentis]KAI0603820.1 hypothetical protein TUN205_11938 [Pyrenophora tritici-repentis]KAI0616044.1 hypothetical protein TUN199_11974 [Pyrenophora tritici-repentis]